MKKNFGMWIFLVSEVLIFGTFIILFEIFYFRYHAEFKLASKDLHLAQGTFNTFILLTSSWFVARALEKKKRSNLLIASFLGMMFLGIKGHEYWKLTQEGKFPLHFENVSQTHQLFFTFYGYMTFIHALHLVIGIICLLYVFYSWRKFNDSITIEENVGLYWHFVDVVWVFLYPIFYLAGNA